jgi:cytochrome b561
MQGHDDAPTPSRWPARVIALHWLSAAAVAVAVGLALAHRWTDDRELLAWHRAAGALVFMLTLARLAVRTNAHRPPHATRRWTRNAAAVVHALLYALLIAVPALGYAITSARLGRVEMIGIEWPALIARDTDLADTLEDLHRGVAWGLLSLAGLHAAAALWHHWGARDDILRRMLRP